MSNLSDYQKRKLLDNPNIEKITENHIVFTAAFKIKAVESYFQGLIPEQIFLEAGIQTDFFSADYPRMCIKKWKKKYTKEGKDSFKTESRGSGATGRPRKVNPEELTMDELRAIIDIQRDLIEHLKKKKALTKKIKK